MSLAKVRTHHGWNFQFRRNFNDWEIGTVIDIFRRLELLQEQGMNMIDYGGAEITKAHSR